MTVIDTLIRKLEQKLEKLRNIKQSLLNLMFVSVNKGGYAPLIRFKGYDDEWKTNELNEVAKRYFVSNQSVHHQNLLSLSYGKIKRKISNQRKGYCRILLIHIKLLKMELLLCVLQTCRMTTRVCV